jgi:GTP cyclohydrolase II
VPSAGIAARIVAALGVTDVVLLTDSPSDFPHGAFAAAGLTVVGTEPLLSKRR